MEELFIGVLLGILGTIAFYQRSKPHPSPKTTRQLLNATPPKNHICLADDCLNVPRPGGWYCDGHKELETASVS